MGKKSKANRKKAPVATSTATATVAATATATATAETTAAGLVEDVEFPESTFWVKAESFCNKGNYSKAQKIYLQGIENGCVNCLCKYSMKILNDGSKIESMHVFELMRANINLHLVLPLLLEGAIRGSHYAMIRISGVYGEARNKTDYVSRHGHSIPAAPLIRYWSKHDLKSYTGEDRKKTKQAHGDQKESAGSQCGVCQKIESETVTLRKCDGCKFYYYCSKACQQKMWREGQHAGVCRHLGLLNKYHKPFATKIKTDLVVHRIAPKDIPELQELRQRLGLSRPQVDYQELLEEAQVGRLDPTQLILPRQDGTVQIGSFPRPI